MAKSILYRSGTVKFLLFAGFIGGMVVAIDALTGGRSFLKK
ncbi:MAG: hypothetical protein ABDH19_03165 [Thermodesulfovibrio sp.]